MTSFSAKGKSASSSRLLSMPVMRGWGGGGEDKMSAEDKTRLEALIDSSVIAPVSMARSLGGAWLHGTGPT